MDVKDAETLHLLADRLRQLFPDARIWAFGSRVRGEATAESDFDICVVLPEMDPHGRRTVSDVAWEVGFARDVIISTVVFSKEMFEHGRCSVSSLVHTVLREGIAA